MGLHCEPRPASTSFDYFKQGQSNSMDDILAGDSAPNASGTSPALGYSMELMCFILFMFMLILNICTCSVSLTIVIEILFIHMFNFEIKISPKIPIFLTDEDTWESFAQANKETCKREESDQETKKTKRGYIIKVSSIV